MSKIASGMALGLLLSVLLSACSSDAPKPSPLAAPVTSAGGTPVAAPQSARPPVPAARPSATATAAPVVPANPTVAVNPIPSDRSIFFEFDKADIRQEFMPVVQAHAKYLKEHPGAKIAIQGNADERGAREYNLSLGQRRSEVVQKALRLLGVSERQMEAISFGEEKPRALGHDEKSWAENRRSDIAYVKAQ